MGDLIVGEYRVAKNLLNGCTFILFDGVLSGRYKISGLGLNAKVGDEVIYKAQQIGDKIWLSVLWRYAALTLLKRIDCGSQILSNDEIYQIAIQNI